MSNSPKTLPKASHELSQSLFQRRGGYWHALWVCQGAEFHVFEELVSLRREAWLPSYSVMVSDKGMKQWRRRAHLPCYLFVKLEPLQSVKKIEAIKFVREVVKQGGVPVRLPEALMAALHADLDPLTDRPFDELADFMARLKRMDVEALVKGCLGMLRGVNGIDRYALGDGPGPGAPSALMQAKCGA